MPSCSPRLRRFTPLFFLSCLIYFLVQTGINWNFSASEQKYIPRYFQTGRKIKEPSTNSEDSKDGNLPRPGPNNVMYGLKTGANILWNDIPLHAATFKKWPQHMAYAEIGELVGDEPVIDLFEHIPENVINNEALKGTEL